MAPTDQSIGREENCMTDDRLREALAEFVPLGNALDAEAKRRYGPNAFPVPRGRRVRGADGG